MSNLAVYITIAVSGLQTLLIVLTLIYTRYHFKLERAASYIARFNSEDMIKNRAAVERWLSRPVSECKRLSELEEDPELMIRIFTFINIFQEVGVGYRNKMVHRRSTESYYGHLIISYWDRTRFLIEWRREVVGRPTLYEDFQYAAERFARKRKRPGHSSSPATGLAVQRAALFRSSQTED